MTADVSLARRLAELPGLSSAPAKHCGVWRVRVEPAGVADVARSLFANPPCTLLLLAGEDRRYHTGDMRAHYLFGERGAHELIHVELPLAANQPSIPTLAGLSFPASRFEREMRDLLGIEPVGHPDPRPLVRHGFWPEDFHPLLEGAGIAAFGDDGRSFPFTIVEGEGVFEIPVGPVHAGVIEPGHFRFSVLGETILKMRARLYFTHKGTEKLFAGRSPRDGVALAERISGDTSAGHALAYCQAIESISGTVVPERAQALRVVLLELERIYNHITDVGAIIADTGFPVGQGHCMRLREAVLRVNKRLTGHRLLRGAIVPGGVRWPNPPDGGLVSELQRIATDFAEVTDICLENTLVRDRVEAAGVLSADVARDFGVVGYVARACGIADDVRVDYPDPGYSAIAVAPAVEVTGDVRARTVVRIREVSHAVSIIEQALARRADETLLTELRPLEPFQAGFGVVEGWRGRIVHLVMGNHHGTLHRVKVVDPSFFNWPSLARALEDNIVPDFPLCNKSFNQSYSGNDL
jgi:Ni,Fe-hydrogenase III large subunit/Ni,Fe-hydrogenase III component G